MLFKVIYKQDQGSGYKLQQYKMAQKSHRRTDPFYNRVTLKHSPPQTPEEKKNVEWGE